VISRGFAAVFKFPITFAHSDASLPPAVILSNKRFFFDGVVVRSEAQEKSGPDRVRFIVMVLKPARISDSVIKSGESSAALLI